MIEFFVFKTYLIKFHRKVSIYAVFSLLNEIHYVFDAKNSPILLFNKKNFYLLNLKTLIFNLKNSSKKDSLY